MRVGVEKKGPGAIPKDGQAGVCRLIMCGNRNARERSERFKCYY